MFSFEASIRARLDAARADPSHPLAALRGVYGLAELEAEKARPTPCAYVAYDGARMLETGSDARLARVMVRWLVVLAVKNVTRAGGTGASAEAARGDAQPLVDGVIATLMGWQPQGAQHAVRLIELPAPQFIAGTLFVPLVFEAARVISGAPK